MAKVNSYSKSYDGAISLSPHFKVREFACKDGSDPIFISDDLVELLEKIRNHFNRPVIIISGFRTASYNKKKSVKGRPHSQHLYGTAADIKIDGVPPKEVAAYARQLMPNRGGVGIYRSFTHVDVREEKAAW